MEQPDDITLGSRDQQRVWVIERVIGGQLTVAEAAAALGRSARQIYRLKAAYERASVRGLVHGNRGRKAQNRIGDEERRRIVTLATSVYQGLNRNHLRDLLWEREGIVVSVPSLRRILLAGGVAPAKRRRVKQHRGHRDRMTQEGMLLQVDGSRHRWFGPDRPFFTLLAAIDDATGRVVAAVFREQEDAHGYLLLLRQVLLRYGAPLELYHDGHGTFIDTKTKPLTLTEQLAGKRQPTQFGRALEELGIMAIRARSPQAKGRVERLWGTCQDRLLKELALEGITDIDASNRFLPAYFERHNMRFAVRADDPGLAYRPVVAGLDLERVLSFQYERVVANDNTVSLDGSRLQIPADAWRRSYAKATVTVHQLLDGSIGIWYQGRWLLRTPTAQQPIKLTPFKHRSSGKRRGEQSTDLVTPPDQDQMTLPPPSSPTRRSTKPPANHPWRRPPPRQH